MAGRDPVAAVLRRDRLIMTGGLAMVTLVAALYTLFGVGMNMSALEMTSMFLWGSGMEGGGMRESMSAMESSSTGMSMTAMQAPLWSANYALLVFLMWWVMMIAMMVPSAAPMVLLYAALKRKSQPEPQVRRLTAIFLAGYLLVWAAFSLLATGLQWGLELRGLISPMMMEVTSHALGGSILLAAGLYQLTPFKHACLEHCRSPVHFLSRHHRPGWTGALRMGLWHGAFCLGCCWFLMALLFFGGIMNLLWIAGIALFVLVEKVSPWGHQLARLSGVALTLCGVWLLGRTFGLS